MPRQIDQNKCLSCGSCYAACPVEAVVKFAGKYQINEDECVDCESCWRVCPEKCNSGSRYPHKNSGNVGILYKTL